LALASMAESAFVGLSRSSSDLILELIEFNRKMRAWREGIDPASVPAVDKCLLKKIVPVKRIKKNETDADLGPNATATVTEVTADDAESHEQLMQPEGPCSCLNPNAKEVCCERVIRRSHKQGYVLTRELFQGTYSGVEVTQNFRSEIPTTVDYRDVVITRDMYESLVSGR